MTTIPRIPRKKYGSNEYNFLVQKASDEGKLFMVIIDSIKYSKIEYDLITFKPNASLSPGTNEEIMEIYEGYVKSNSLSDKHFLAAGGNRNLILTVKKNDAELFALKLYELILNNIKLL